MKKLLTLSAIIITQLLVGQSLKPSSGIFQSAGSAVGLVQYKSIHQEESEKYAQYHFSKEAQWDSLYNFENPGRKSLLKPINKSRSCALTKRVFGWNPYWISSAQYNNYDYSLLTDLSYFSYGINSSTGGYSTIHSWLTSSVVTNAESAGVKVSLCANLFSGHATFLGSASSKQNFITTIIGLVHQRNGSGINIDFEGLPSAQSANFTSFIIDLCNQAHATTPALEVSMALPSVNWSGTYDVASMNAYVDLFIIMGYDYYYSGSANAGPVSPKNNGNFWSAYDCSRSIIDYLNEGVSRNKLCLGVPYYGTEWPTSSSSLNSATTGTGTSKVYYTAVANAATYGRQWNNNSSTPYYMYNSSGWKQCWYDDEISLASKYDLVNIQNLAGIGIWALGYDDGYTECWDAIKNSFTTCLLPTPCSGTLNDMGGPGNYYNKENWTYTIAPPSATSVSLAFSSFNVEANYDYLYAYDGNSTSSPLIGTYTGTTIPGTLTASSGKLTLRFTSDTYTVASGWNATWGCVTDTTANVPDIVAPTTQINTPASWVTQNFTTAFTDTDNMGGSGIAKSYYLVSDYNGTEWRANNGNGFFNDNFDTVIHPDWNVGSGIWSINTGRLDQTDQTNTNTNIYAPLTQNLSNCYLYNWKGKINGTGTTRRAGFHFFCDDATQSNRGNSYFVWFRVDQNACEFYKVVNNTFILENSVPMTTAANQWYDWKVIYDRILGKMDVYQNNVFVGSWTDPTPISTGNAVSFRSANCEYQVNDFKVFRSRFPSLAVSVGSASNNDVRYQNPNPSSPSCKIYSITKDVAGNLSAIVTKTVKVDWTVPSSVLVNDGTGIDIDTTFSGTQLSANWTVSADTNSGVAKYWYAIGTTAGATDVVNWTTDSLNTVITQTGLSLTTNQNYYFSVKAENGAGLQSDSTNTDGQIVLTPSGINELSNGLSLVVYPNPFHETCTLMLDLQSQETIEISLFDVLGKEIILLPMQKKQKGKYQFVINKFDLNLAEGMYILKLKTESKEVFTRLMME